MKIKVDKRRESLEDDKDPSDTASEDFGVGLSGVQLKLFLSLDSLATRCSCSHSCVEVNILGIC